MCNRCMTAVPTDEDDYPEDSYDPTLSDILASIESRELVWS